MRCIACIASGPSLTALDCEKVRDSGLFTIVVNNTWKLAQWADVLYAGDRSWWNYYGREAKAAMRECWTASHDSAERFGIRRFDAKDFENSGYQAIELAVHVFGAGRVILLGYDMQHTQGRAHWHADHPGDMGNADAVADWPDRFQDLAEKLHAVDIINASRETALTCFRRMELEEVVKCKQAS